MRICHNQGIDDTQWKGTDATQVRTNLARFPTAEPRTLTPTLNPNPFPGGISEDLVYNLMSRYGEDVQVLNPTPKTQTQNPNLQTQNPKPKTTSAHTPPQTPNQDSSNCNCNSEP